MLRTYRDSHGKSLDQSRKTPNTNWTYDAGMASLVFYLLVRVLNVAEESADGGKEIHTAELNELVRRAGGGG